MEILLQIHSLFGHIDQAYLNAAKVGGWVVGIVTAITWVVSKLIKLAEGVTKIKDHFEANQEFRENTAKVLDELLTGQAVAVEISKLVISKTGSFFFKANDKGETIYVGDDLTAATGIPFSQVENYGWVNYVHEDDRTMVREAIKNTIASKSDWDIPFRFKMGDAYQKVRSEARRVIRPDKNGVIVNYVGTITPQHN